MTEEEQKRALDPLRSFHLQRQEEITHYERLKRGDLDAMENLHGLGRMLIALRIALGLTQRPLAERLGLYNLKLELEDLGFRALYPQRYRVLERAMKRARGNQKEFLPKIAGQIRIGLENAGIEARVEAREKHLYSIYRKMTRKRTALADIIDVYGLRVIVDKADTCYRALRTRDARFDGRFFVAVRTTGIYCRPICPARTPKLENVAFHASAASVARTAASSRGLSHACRSGGAARLAASVSSSRTSTWKWRASAAPLPSSTPKRSRPACMRSGASFTGK